MNCDIAALDLFRGSLSEVTDPAAAARVTPARASAVAGAAGANAGPGRCRAGGRSRTRSHAEGMLRARARTHRRCALDSFARCARCARVALVARRSGPPASRSVGGKVAGLRWTGTDTGRVQRLRARAQTAVRRCRARVQRATPRSMVSARATRHRVARMRSARTSAGRRHRGTPAARRGGNPLSPPAE